MADHSISAYPTLPAVPAGIGRAANAMGASFRARSGHDCLPSARFATPRLRRHPRQRWATDHPACRGGLAASRQRRARGSDAWSRRAHNDHRKGGAHGARWRVPSDIAADATGPRKPSIDIAKQRAAMMLARCANNQSELHAQADSELFTEAAWSNPTAKRSLPSGPGLRVGFALLGRQERLAPV